MRRRTAARTMAVGMLSFALAGCSSGDHATTAQSAEDAPPAAPAAPGDWPASARAAMAAWDDFPVDADPRPILLTRSVLGPSGFETAEQKNSFESGNWTVPEKLPPTPRSAGGYPVISAREALERLRTADGNGAGKREGVPLRVTEIELATVQARTDRGPLRLPAWKVLFTGSIGPNWIPAIAPPARYDHPMPESYEPAAEALPGGRVVRLHFVGAADSPGPCGADYTAELAESREAVAYRIVPVPRPRPTLKANAGCAALGYGRIVQVTLAEPLGNRVLLDVPSAGDVRGPVPVTS